MSGLPYFGIVVPGHPLNTNYVQTSPTQFVFQITRKPTDQDFIIFKFPMTDRLPQDHGIGVYLSVYGDDFEYYGHFTEANPSVKIKFPLENNTSQMNIVMKIGLSVEQISELVNKENNSATKERYRNQVDTIVKATANNLYTFLSSFAQKQGDSILIPSNALERWIQKLKSKPLEL